MCIDDIQVEFGDDNNKNDSSANISSGEQNRSESKNDNESEDCIDSEKEICELEEGLQQIITEKTFLLFSTLIKNFKIF